jgi:hypothetical protein
LARPSRANGALVPACCAAALAVLAALQLALTSDVALPEAGWTGGGGQLAMPRIGTTAIPGRLREDPIFSPTRSGSPGAEGATHAGPLGGNSIAGAITVGRRSFAMILRPDGTILRLPVGGMIDGHQLLALSPDGAVFRKDGKRVHVAFGAGRIPPTEPSAGYQEEQE